MAMEQWRQYSKYAQIISRHAVLSEILFVFFVKYERTSVDSFDGVTRDIDEETAAGDTTRDIALDRPTNDIIEVTVAEECDHLYSNPDDPIVED